MTSLRRRRSLAFVLALSLLVLGTPLASGTAVPDLPAASEVIGGANFGREIPALACIGCLAGGVILASSGFATVLAAAMKRGSLFAFIGCANMCYRAVSR